MTNIDRLYPVDADTKCTLCKGVAEASIEFTREGIFKIVPICEECMNKFDTYTEIFNSVK